LFDYTYETPKEEIYMRDNS